MQPVCHILKEFCDSLLLGLLVELYAVHCLVCVSAYRKSHIVKLYLVKADLSCQLRCLCYVIPHSLVTGIDPGISCTVTDICAVCFLKGVLRLAFGKCGILETDDARYSIYIVRPEFLHESCWVIYIAFFLIGGDCDLSVVIFQVYHYCI